ncbi:hypothetical protein [Roseibium sp.]|uniref:hypothetical protein n=1 Tax=Roseibium sp. TaxID=1936156 RepID=UPI003A97E929
MVSALTSYSALLAIGGGFALTILLYFGLAALYKSTALPRWMNGDIVPMSLCVFLTGAIVALVIGMFTASSALPFGLLGDWTIATGTLLASGFAAALLFKALTGLFHHTHKV